MSEPDEKTHRDTTTGRLLRIVEDLSNELHPGRSRQLARPASLLESELGLDSLARVELLRRIEMEFTVHFSEAEFARAERVNDLVTLLAAAAQEPGQFAWCEDRVEREPHSETTPADLQDVETLPELLRRHAAAQPERTHIYLLGENGSEQRITYSDLLTGAANIAGALLAREWVRGRCVGIMLPTGRDYLFSFFGVMLAGAIPVPIYPPARLAQVEDHLRRHAGILANAGAVLLIAPRQAQTLTRLLQAQVESLRAVCAPEDLRETTAPPVSAGAGAGDIALLQYTSGSTGQPKGVTLSHAQILSNIRAMGQRAQVDSRDCFVSWLPLYHDMGLIGAWLGSLYYSTPLVLMSPLQFVLRPRRWLWAIHRFRGTLSASPNFGYQLCLDKIRDADLRGLDLGSWRLAFNGAEPVSPQTMHGFAARFADYGFRPEALAPVYGLAESAVGVAFPAPNRGVLIDRVRRALFSREGRAIPAAADDRSALEFVACGQPLPGYELRVADAGGRELPERCEGRVEFRGPSATSGYFHNPEADRHLFDNGWLDTGDLGYIVGGDVYPTSRIKDIIIRGGRNIYPYEVEEAVGELPEIRKGCVAVFGSDDPRSGTERIIVLAETKLRDDAQALERLRARVQALVTGLLDMPPDEVVLVRPHTILKTSSGKIRRAASRDLFEQGKLNAHPPPWRQMAGLGLHAIGPEWRRLRSLVAARLYGAYVYALLLFALPPLWLLMLLIRDSNRRWRVAQVALRVLFRLLGVNVRVQGVQNLVAAAGGAVLVANHASYLDSPALAAALPLPLSFVAKAELRRLPLIGELLCRLNTEFVERFHRDESVESARHLSESVHAGRTLLVFPEGTLQRMPGLRSFHLGAFSAAAANGVPVIPVTIIGTRSILRDGSWLPRRGDIEVRIAPAVKPRGGSWPDTLALRDAARAQMLMRIDEPDLEVLGLG